MHNQQIESTHMKVLSGKYVFPVVIISLTLMSALYYSHYNALLQNELNDKQTKATTVILNSSEDLLIAMLSAESSNRGYEMTQHKSYLENYNKAQKEANNKLAQLKKLTIDDTLQQMRLDSISNLMSTKFAIMDEQRTFINDKHPEKAYNMLKSGLPREMMDNLKDVINRFKSQEESNARIVTEKEIESSRKSFTTLLIGSMASFGVIGILLVLIYYENKKRKKTEDELYVSMQRFMQTLSSMGDGVIATDTNGVITFFNKISEELTGWKRTEATGTHIDLVFDIINEKTGLKVMNPVMEALKRNRIVLLANHTILTRKDGTRLFIDDSGAPIHNMEGKVVGAVLVFRDITEKKNKEQEIKDLNEILKNRIEEKTKELMSHELLFRNTLDNMLEGFQIIDFDWRYTYVNDAFTKHAKYSRKELIGHTVMEKYPGIENTEIYKVYQRCFKERVPIQLDNEFEFPDKSIGWFELSFQPVPEGIAILSVDISGRKRTEKKLMESEHKYRQVVDNISNGIIVDDVAGNIVFVNDQFLELFGLTNDDYKGMKLEDYVAPEYHKLLRDRHNKRVAGEDVPNFFDYEGIRKDGVRRWFEVRVSTVIENNKIVGTQSAIRDITERKESERVLNETNIELKKINSELDRFVYSISHELRSPLSSTLGLIHLLKRGSFDDESKTYVTLIDRCIYNMDQTLREILDYSQNARIDLEIRQIDLKTLIEDSFIYNDIRKFLINKKINVTEDELFYSDRSRLKVILNNLISNAIKYSKEDTTLSFIEINAIISPEKLILKISDNGIGIREEHLSKIFGMFARATTASSGSGLGLYIVKECLEKVNGSISVESKLGDGTKFTIEIPNNIP